MKDNFSRQSGAYAKFRPVYPPELYDFIFAQVAHFERAWDCGTGNGQVAGVLAGRFGEVYATDISQKQLDKAVRRDNIHYSLQAAETADFPPQYFDLITVGQAIHWFDHARFYKLVRRCLRPGGVLAAFGYPLFRINPALDRVIDHFYHDIVGPYWDAERHHIDDAYARIPFPFQRIPVPDLSMSYAWTLPQTFGYLTTWSAVQHYQQARHQDPIDLIREALTAAWGTAATHPVHFRVISLMGKV